MECQEWKIWESREFLENTINVPTYTFHEKKNDHITMWNNSKFSLIWKKISWKQFIV